MITEQEYIQAGERGQDLLEDLYWLTDLEHQELDQILDLRRQYEAQTAHLVTEAKRTAELRQGIVASSIL